MVASTRSPYGYVAGNPLNGGDPSGLDFNLPFGGLCVHFFFGSNNCQGSLSQDVVKSGAFKAANGFANGFTFGLSTKVEGALGAAPDTSCAQFQGGSIGGNVSGAVLLPLGAVRAIRADAAGIDIAESNAGHIFRDATGHLAEDTPANRALLQDTANNSANYVSTDANGVATYRQTLPDGTQAWAEVYHGQITNGGVNVVPR